MAMWVESAKVELSKQKSDSQSLEVLFFHRENVKGPQENKSDPS